MKIYDKGYSEDLVEKDMKLHRTPNPPSTKVSSKMFSKKGQHEEYQNISKMFREKLEEVVALS